jgi:hypothetical protein
MRAYAAIGTIASMCDLTHGNADEPCIDSIPMEWVLQVADEIDDAIGAVRHGWVGLTAPIGGLMSSFTTAFTTALKARGLRLRSQP